MRIHKATTIGALAVTAALVVGVAPVSASRPHKPISRMTAGKQYLALVAPVNAAAGAFIQQAHSWTSSTSDTTAESDAKPAIAAFEKLNRGLLDDRWPSGDRSDIRSLVSADGALVGDLQGLASVNLLSSSSWLTTFDRDEQAVAVAVAEVRHDLGLPAAKS